MPDRIILAAVGLWGYLSRPNLILRYRRKIGKFPRIAVPRGYNEKFLWRKLFDRNPILPVMCDKLRSKKFFLERCPDLQAAEVLWVGARPEDIPDDVLAGNVVVKANYGAALNVFVREGRIDRHKLNGQINRWRRAFYPYGQKDGEWAYGEIAPKIFVERMVLDKDGNEPMLINVLIMGGEPQIFAILVNVRNGIGRIAVFNPDGTKIGTNLGHFQPEENRFPEDFTPPTVIGEIIEHARAVGRDIDQVRVDFMWSNGQIYCSEITPYTAAGYGTYDDPAIAKRLGDAWDLKRSWFLKSPQTGWRGLYARALQRRLDSTTQKSSQ